MSKFLNYFFAILGIIFIIKGIGLILDGDPQAKYELFFGIQFSKPAYVIYELILGVALLLSSVKALQNKKE